MPLLVVHDIRRYFGVVVLLRSEVPAVKSFLGQQAKVVLLMDLQRYGVHHGH